MTSLKLKAVAAELPALIARLAALEAELPEGRTRDVVEKAQRLLNSTNFELSYEAGVLARSVEDM